MRIHRSAVVMGMAALTWCIGHGGAKAESMMDRIVLSRCSAAMTSDFAKAGKIPPEGLVNKTCQCVLKTYKATSDINTAKQTCTQQARQEMPQAQASEMSKPTP